MNCFVPGCKKTKKRNPNLKFFKVPYSKERLQWFSVVGKDTGMVNMKSSYYCCESHIKLVLDALQGQRNDKNEGRNKVGSLPFIKYQDDSCIEPVTQSSLSNGFSKSALISRPEKITISTQVTPKMGLPSYTQTTPKEAVCISTQTTSRKELKTDNGSTFNSFSTVTSVSDRSSNLEAYVPASSEKSSDESYVDNFSICNTILSMMKARPKHYMGINKKCLHIIRLLVKKTKLSEVKIMLTLRKIRLNEEFQTLGDLFDIDRRTAGRYFNDSIGPIAKYIKKFLKYVKPKSMKRNLPISFRRNYNRIGAIVDCFEIQIEKPSKPKKQAKSWSQYKTCNTIKYLVCVTPDGLIYYVSRGYGGRSSDLVITTTSKLQKCLRPDFFVMADRGFKGIENVLLKKGSKLFRPPREKHRSNSRLQYV